VDHAGTLATVAPDVDVVRDIAATDSAAFSNHFTSKEISPGA